MTSRERLLRTLRREPVDRVPICTYELNAHNPHNFENKAPSYKRLMEHIRRDTDCVYMWGFHPWAADNAMEQRHETLPDGTIETYVCLHGPKGDLTAKGITKPNIYTTWMVEHPIKCLEDIDKFIAHLSISNVLDEENVKRAQKDYAQIDEALGDDGIIMSDGADPSGCVPGLFEFGLFTEYCYQHPDKIHELIDAFSESTLLSHRIKAECGFGPMTRIYGPEYYTPPYLPPELFREFCLPSLKKTIDVLSEGGILVRVHSHGRIRDALPMIVESGAKAIDPVEPPPDGNIPLAEVKQLYGDDLVLFGNTELKLQETAEPGVVRETVRQQMADAKEGGGYVLMCTASPINEPLSPRTEQNYIEWIDAGLEFGQY